MIRARDQRLAVETVLESGGRVGYDYQIDSDGTEIRDAQPPGPNWLRELIGPDYFCTVVHVNLYGPNVTDHVLAKLSGLPRLRELRVHRAIVSDQGLVHLRHLTQLRTLVLANCPRVTDAGLHNLRAMSSLRELSLRGTSVRGDGLAHLESLTKLETLLLAKTRIKDAALRHVTAFPRLEKLDLAGTQVTDLGIARLEVMSQLEHLDLRRTSFTLEESWKLQDKLPQLYITFY